MRVHVCACVFLSLSHSLLLLGNEGKHSLPPARRPPPSARCLGLWDLCSRAIYLRQLDSLPQASSFIFKWSSHLGVYLAARLLWSVVKEVPVFGRDHPVLPSNGLTRTTHCGQTGILEPSFLVCKSAVSVTQGVIKVEARDSQPQCKDKQIA